METANELEAPVYLPCNEQIYVSLLVAVDDDCPDNLPEDFRYVDCAYAEGYHLAEVPNNMDFFDVSAAQWFALLGYPASKGLP